MTATNLVNKFEYKPLYKPNQLICGTGQTAIVSGWTVKSAIGKKLQPHEFAVIRQFTAFSQSFPLIAEVAYPEDSGEELFTKAQEYLESGCLEVWLLWTEARLIFVNAGQRWLLFNADEVVNTLTVLAGFSVAVSELLA